MTAAPRAWEGGRPLLLGGLTSAGVGLATWVAALVVDRRHALAAYLTSYLFVLTTAVGALIFLMTTHAVRAEWTVAIQGLTERVVALLPVLTVAFLPVALGVRQLYPWADPESTSGHLREVMKHQAPYLNVPFAVSRGVAFLALWSALGTRLIRLGVRRDAAWRERQWRLSGVGLVLTAITLTLFAIDWVMSLTPTWSSTIFGFYFFAGGFISAFSALVLLMTAADRTGALPDVLQPGHFLSMGKLMLAFTIFWAYMAYSQYFIIWIADIPRETSWYLARGGGWTVFSVVLVVMHFVVPFAMLLSRDLKTHPARLSFVGAWILVAHYLDMYWLVTPAFSPDGPNPGWIDLGAAMLVLGIVVSAGVWLARGKQLLPLHDPDLAVALAYEGT